MIEGADSREKADGEADSALPRSPVAEGLMLWGCTLLAGMGGLVALVALFFWLLMAWLAVTLLLHAFWNDPSSSGEEQTAVHIAMAAMQSALHAESISSCFDEAKLDPPWRIGKFFGTVDWRPGVDLSVPIEARLGDIPRVQEADPELADYKIAVTLSAQDRLIEADPGASPKRIEELIKTGVFVEQLRNVFGILTPHVFSYYGSQKFEAYNVVSFAKSFYCRAMVPSENPWNGTICYHVPDGEPYAASVLLSQGAFKHLTVIAESVAHAANRALQNCKTEAGRVK